jgi:formate hydrogenlyase subunit 4
MHSILLLGIVLLIAPLFPGIILKVKAFFAGKQGPPVLIKYYTLIKLCRKGSVYSTSTSFVFRMGPTVSCATALLALVFVPFGGVPPLLAFQGDVIVLFYILGIGRFFTILAALDTASPFEGMGAAREAFFATLAEATIFIVLVLFYRMNGSLSLADFFSGDHQVAFTAPNGALLLLVVVAMFMILLTENSRVPVDDPATHLELTMIHEVMILDHSGPDLALIELGAFYKLFFSSAFIANLLLPPTWAGSPLGIATFLLCLILIYAAIGLTESIMARFRMKLVPKFILTSFALVFFAAILSMGLAT